MEKKSWKILRLNLRVNLPVFNPPPPSFHCQNSKIIFSHLWEMFIFLRKNVRISSHIHTVSEKVPPCMTLHWILVRNLQIFLTVQMVSMSARARHPMPTTFSFETLKSVGSERKSHWTVNSTQRLLWSFFVCLNISPHESQEHWIGRHRTGCLCIFLVLY